MKRTASSVLASLFAIATIGVAGGACSSPTTPNLTDTVAPGDDTNTNTGGTTTNGDDDANSNPTSTPDASVASTDPASDAGAMTVPVSDMSDASTGVACPYVGPSLPTNKYPACLPGGVCVPLSTVPAAQQADFATCTGGLCLPQKVVAAFGEYLPTTCAAAENAEGRCLSTVLPSVQALSASLAQSTCDANELCTPCYNPLDGTDTGACETVKCDKPMKPAVTFTACCKINGTNVGKCVPSSTFSSALASQLFSCNDSEGNVCAPDENLDSTFKPKFCHYDDGFLGFDDYDGFCVSNCVMNSQGLDHGNCDSAHFCAPCEDGDGNPTHVPGCNN